MKKLFSAVFCLVLLGAIISESSQASAFNFDFVKNLFADKSEKMDVSLSPPSTFQAPISYLKYHYLHEYFEGSGSWKYGSPADELPNVPGMGKAFPKAENFESFLASQKETLIGAPEDLISSAMKSKGKYMPVTSPGGWKSLERAMESYMRDDSVKQAIIAHYYWVMNRLLNTQMAVLENIVAIDVFTTKPLLNGVVIREDNPFAVQLNAKVSALTVSPPAFANPSISKIYDNLEQLYANVLLPMEVELKEVDDKIRDLRTFNPDSPELSDLYPRRSKLFDDLYAIKAVKAKWTLGKIYGTEFRNLRDSYPDMPLRTVIQGASDKQLREEDRVTLLNYFNELQDLSALMNKPDALRLDVDSSSAYFAFRNRLKSAFSKSTIRTSSKVKSTHEQSVVPFKFVAEYDPRADPDYLKKSRANYLFVQIEDRFGFLDATIEEKKTFDSLTTGIALAIIGFGAGSFGSFSALMSANLVKSSASGLRVLLGMAVVGSDIYYSYDSVQEAVSVCSESMETWDKPIGAAAPEGAFIDFGPSASYDYGTCVIAGLIATVQVATVVVPPFVAAFYETPKGTKAKNLIENGIVPIAPAIAKAVDNRLMVLPSKSQGYLKTPGVMRFGPEVNLERAGGLQKSYGYQIKGKLKDRARELGLDAVEGFKLEDLPPEVTRKVVDENRQFAGLSIAGDKTVAEIMDEKGLKFSYIKREPLVKIVDGVSSPADTKAIYKTVGSLEIFESDLSKAIVNSHNEDFLKLFPDGEIPKFYELGHIWLEAGNPNGADAYDLVYKFAVAARKEGLQNEYIVFAASKGDTIVWKVRKLKDRAIGMNYHVERVKVVANDIPPELAPFMSKPGLKSIEGPVNGVVVNPELDYYVTVTTISDLEEAFKPAPIAP